MPNKELVNFIKNSFKIGVSKETIKKSLLEAGWSEWDIDATFSFVELEKRKDNELTKEELGGDFPKPVIEKIQTVDDNVCEMLKRGKSRDQIFEELINAYDYNEIKRAFDKNNIVEERRMSPAASLGFFVLIVSFFSFLSIVWDRLTGESRIYTVLSFCLLYFISGLYVKYKEKIIFAGEVICFFSAMSLGFVAFLLASNPFLNLTWIDSFALWTVSVLLMGIIADSLLILKVALLLGSVPAFAYIFMMIKDGESFFSQGFMYMILFFVSLLLGIVLVNKKTNN